MFLHSTLRVSAGLNERIEAVPDGIRQPEELAELAGHIAAAEPLWRPILRFGAEDRWWERLLLTDSIEVWLLSWLPGQQTQVHGHGGANCAFTVVDGALTETIYRLTGESAATATVEAAGAPLRRAAGTSVTMGPRRIHRVANDGLAPASSIHVYSPPGVPLDYYTVKESTAVQRSVLEPAP